MTLQTPYPVQERNSRLLHYFVRRYLCCVVLPTALLLGFYCAMFASLCTVFIICGLIRVF
jgi:hypothetical protein